jgi:hypothetical protein
MLFKTERGRNELRPGHRSLGQRERAVLLLVDGQQTEAVISQLFNGDGRRLIERLITDGFIGRQAARSGATVVDAAAPRTPAARAPSAREPVLVSRDAEPAPAANTAHHGDTFSGARSLASARMFLFDLSERLFAPRDKALAARYREALREAREAQDMLAVGRAMIADVEALAGRERADSIRERLAKMLPSELLAAA